MADSWTTLSDTSRPTAESTLSRLTLVKVMRTIATSSGATLVRPTRVSSTSRPDPSAPSRRLLLPSAPSAWPSTPLTRVSSSTRTVSTTSPSVTQRASTTVSSSSDMEHTREMTFGWLRTPGPSTGDSTDTFGWPGTKTTSAVSHPAPHTPSSNQLLVQTAKTTA